MKVKICYTVEVDDTFRRKIKEWYGEEGLANREDIQNWFRLHGESRNDDLADTVTEENSEN